MTLGWKLSALHMMVALTWMVIVAQIGMEILRRAAVSFHHMKPSVRQSSILIQLCLGPTKLPLLTMAGFLALCRTLVAGNLKLLLKLTHTSHCQSAQECAHELPIALFSLSRLMEVEGRVNASCTLKAAGGTELAEWSMMKRERLCL